ncbi:MAG: acyltransferase [Gammaproteobacteria bacterium]
MADLGCTSQMDYFRSNNFDLIRLVAAAQVMLFHAIFYFDVPVPTLNTIISYAPGVPAFFFVSGFLISASWERNSDLRTFAVNRILRIFPGLWAVLGFSLITLFAFYDRSLLAANWTTLVLWSIGQATILQDWIPDFTRGYGVGGVNGSLWTIPVELSFYVAVPLLYWLFTRVRRVDAVLIAALVASFGLQYWTYTYRAELPELAFKLILKSPLPWFGMFCAGILGQRHLRTIMGAVQGRFMLFLGAYVVAASLAHYFPVYPLLQGNANSMGVINYLAMCGLILSAAYTAPSLAERVLKRNDISYGVYIFHIPVINVFVEKGMSGWGAFFPAVLITIFLAGLSWTYVERPSLGLRRWALYRR